MQGQGIKREREGGFNNRIKLSQNLKALLVAH